MHPFAELTNRTPSPSQKDESNYARKHSPWTAARHKKKTRSVQEQQAGALPAQQAIPEAFDSPAAQVKPAGGNAEYSLADCLSPKSQGTASPHSSPPVSRGSADDAEVHPSKAYITSPQALTSPQGTELGSAGGVDFAAAAARGPAANNCRSPVWFCGSAVADAVQQAGTDTHGHLHASSSAPACGNLFDRFDQVAQQQQHAQAHVLQHHHSQPCLQMHSEPAHQQQHQQVPAGQQCAGAVRSRRLTARRGSWSGSEQPRANATGSMGPSRMGPAAGGGSNSSSLCIAAHAQSSQGCDCQQHQQSLLQQPAGDLQSCQYTCDMGFQLHSALSQIDDSRVEQRRSFGSGFLQQRWQHGEERGAGADWRLAGSAAEWTQRTGIEALTGDVDCAEEGTLAWYEAQIQEASDEGDVVSAQQLWAGMQAEGLQPSHRFMNGFLICCHYGGADPVEAEEAVRDMCAAADMEPDSLTTKLLTLIDISWQQLQCGL